MWVLKVVFLVTIFFASWAMADEIKNPETDETQEETRDPIAKAIEDQQGQVKVVFDITRGVQKARIIKDGQVVSEHKISGAKNEPVVVTVKVKQKDGSFKRVKKNFCAFTTTGIGIKPQFAQKNYKSGEHDKILPHFVMFDSSRGIGAH